ncbi:MAG TPA: hypothetical protein VMT89_01065, partial [Candidatus Acidoferrales bacterium]|nr:hypothetical protein [Candidatus Acidoferrales bacterium]
MCGICGIVESEGGDSVDPTVLASMMDAMAHRGPDEQGHYISNRAVLGSRRLSIIDLKCGRQPIANEDNTLHIVFNGEIYNYRELREYLLKQGHCFRTHTDTEVILHLYEEFGADALDHLNGVFAIAIWDDRRDELFLARD